MMKQSHINTLVIFLWRDIDFQTDQRFNRRTGIRHVVRQQVGWGLQIKPEAIPIAIIGSREGNGRPTPGAEVSLQQPVGCRERSRIVLLAGTGMTNEEIGKELNVTRERVRQIESSAIKKLKHPKVGRKLKNYIEE